MDIRLERLARLLVEYSNNVKRDDIVEIRGGPVAAPLIEALYRAALQRGALVRTAVGLPAAEEILLREGNAKQVQYFRPTLLADMKEMDCVFSIWAEENTRALSNVDPAQQQLRARALRPLRELFMKRAARRALRWVGTLYPTQGLAQEADMSLADFTDFVFRACKCDRDDPVAAWKEIGKRQERIVKFLKGKKTVRLLAPDTDLTLSVQGRTWENCAGSENMPDGEVFTGPVENATSGTVRFTYPAVHDGREVEDVRLTFQRGKVVQARAAKNEAYLHKMLDLDEGSRRLGELAFGLNEDIQRFTKNILFDEKIGGTVHMALGAAYPETGGRNKSALHWDMICDLRQAGEIYVDDRKVFVNGQWKL